MLLSSTTRSDVKLSSLKNYGPMAMKAIKTVIATELCHLQQMTLEPLTHRPETRCKISSDATTAGGVIICEELIMLIAMLTAIWVVEKIDFMQITYGVVEKTR